MIARTSISEQLSRVILEKLPFPIVVIDRDLRILLANRAFSVLFQLPDHRSLCQKDISNLIPLDGIQDLIAEVQMTARSKEAELQLKLHNGKIKMLKVNATPLAASESVPAFLLTLEDVSERIWLEEQFIQSKQLAAMEQLAAIIAHELGNPLSVIITTLEYVRTQLDEKGEGPFEEIEVIIESVNTMFELLKNLSMFTGLERPHFHLEKINTCLSQVLALIAKQAEKHNVTIETAFAPNLPLCRVDTRQLKQVFLNLVKNALEAMPFGGLLSVSVQGSLPAPPQSVIVQISDTGVGIAEEELAHIFEPFYSTKPGGTGLGLPISQRIIEKHEGSISVSSQPGAGTTFTITLPSARRSECVTNRPS